MEQRRDTLWRTLLSEKTKMERVMRAQQEAEEAKTTSRQAALAEARALKAAAANLQQDAPQVCAPTQIATQRKRLRSGKEEQGGGRMTLFCA